MIDITMTACRRPEILNRTLASFFGNLVGLAEADLRLIINIDPVGREVAAHDCIKVCERYFSNMVIRTPDRPSFPKAFRWVWQQVEAPMVLHLEDDWEMVREASLEDMVRLFARDPFLMIMRLAAFRSEGETMKNWNKFFSWNGEYYEPPEEEKGLLAFCGHPSLIRKSFIEYVAPRLDPEKNPEKQIKGKNGKIGSFLLNFKYGVFSQPDTGPIVRDIGRQWMVQNGFQKKGPKAWFTEWEKC